MNRLLWGLCLFAPLVAADALVVTRAMKASTIAEIFIEPERVVVEFEVGAADLEAFKKEAFIIFAGDDRLVPDLTPPVVRKRRGRDEITGEPVGATEEDVLFIRLVYALADAPHTLVFRPPPGANIGFVTYHEGIAVNDFRYLAHEVTLDLDWTDPWYSHFRSRNLRRRYDAPLNAFLYVDGFEVRQEIVCRPRDLQLLGLDLGLEETIRADQRDAVREKVAAFLAKKNPVTIDGQPARGTLDRIHFVRRTLRTTGVVPAGEAIPTLSATLGVIFVYPVNGLPKKVRMRWELFSPRIQQVPAVATDEAGGLPSFLTPDDPILLWENFLKNPSSTALAEVPVPPAGGFKLPLASVVVLLLGLALRKRATIVVGAVLAAVLWPLVQVPVGGSAGAPPDPDAVMEPLLRNVYRAFDYRGESLIYDTLARSVDGELLRRVYLETRRSLELANQGGARVKVKDVKLEKAVTSEADDGFAVHCTWVVEGSVGHWGHIHTRRNRYEAVFVVRVVEGAWKLASLELLDERRL